VGITSRLSIHPASGRFAMIDDGIGLQLVPWRSGRDKRIGQHTGGLMRNVGGIECGASAGNEVWPVSVAKELRGSPTTLSAYPYGAGPAPSGAKAGAHRTPPLRA
jgi:hypothetical protein